jgi:hypothetical protein
MKRHLILLVAEVIWLFNATTIKRQFGKFTSPQTFKKRNVAGYRPATFLKPT